MPRIPTVLTEKGAAVIQLPQRVPTPDFPALGATARVFSQFGEQLSKIGEQLQQHQNALDIDDLIGQFNGKVKERQSEIRYDNTHPLDRQKKFLERIQDDIASLADTTKNKAVADGFKQYVSRHLPLHSAQVQFDAMEYLGQQQTAQQRDILDRISLQAAQAAAIDSPESVQLYKDLIRRANELINTNPHMLPEAKQKERVRFNRDAQKDYMNFLRREDPERLLREYDKGKFDEVDETIVGPIITRTRNENAARLQHAQTELDKTLKRRVESIERYVVDELKNNRLTIETINEYKGDVSSEKGELWHKMLREQQLGIGGGDPEVIRQVVDDARDPRRSPTARLDTLNELYANGKIDYGTWDKETHFAITDIRTDQAIARSDRREAESRVREIKRHKSSAVERDIESLFTTTSMFDKFDALGATAKYQILDEFRQREESYGQGNEEAFSLKRELVPKYIARVKERAVPLLRNLEQELVKYPNKEALRQVRNSMSPTAWEQLALKMDQLFRMRQQIEQWNAAIKASGGGRPTPKGTR